MSARGDDPVVAERAVSSADMERTTAADLASGTWSRVAKRASSSGSSSSRSCAIIATLGAEFTAVLAGPALILFVAWLMAYVLEPIVSLLHRHLPFKGRGLSVAITYLVTASSRSSCWWAPASRSSTRRSQFIEQPAGDPGPLKAILEPIVGGLGLQLPNGGDRRRRPGSRNSSATTPAQLADAVALAIRNAVIVVAGLITAVFISIGLAVGQVSLLGWMRRFLPRSTYRDLSRARAGDRGLVRRLRPRPTVHRRRSTGDHRRSRRCVFGVPYCAAHRGHRRPDRLHPVDRAADRLGRPAGVRVARSRPTSSSRASSSASSAPSASRSSSRRSSWPARST